MNVRYEQCVGAEVFTTGRARILDFVSGYCVPNARPQSSRELAGELAEKLRARAGGRLRKAFFCSSGGEGIEAAIKFSRVLQS